MQTWCGIIGSGGCGAGGGSHTWTWLLPGLIIMHCHVGSIKYCTLRNWIYLEYLHHDINMGPLSDISKVDLYFLEKPV